MNKRKRRSSDMNKRKRRSRRFHFMIILALNITFSYFVQHKRHKPFEKSHTTFKG
ncbi:hypothetical protein CR513_57474, partial [Mucuna pruriens]